jgi:hypothetical protein
MKFSQKLAFFAGVVLATIGTARQCLGKTPPNLS